LCEDIALEEGTLEPQTAAATPPAADKSVSTGGQAAQGSAQPLHGGTIMMTKSKPAVDRIRLDQIKEVQVIVEKLVERQVEVPKMVAVPVEVIRELVVEVIREIEKPVIKEVYVEVPVETIREVIKTIEVVKIVEVEKIKEVVLEQIRVIEKPIYHTVYEERIKEVEVIKEVVVERVVERIVEKPYEVIVERPVHIVKEIVKGIPYEVRGRKRARGLCSLTAFASARATRASMLTRSRLLLFHSAATGDQRSRDCERSAGRGDPGSGGGEDCVRGPGG
jgi:hypothetical protein